MADKIERVLGLYSKLINGGTVYKAEAAATYANRFEEGEFRKRIQFMFGGKLRKVKLKYKGLSIESVLDRLPTAKIIKENDGEYILTVEAYGNGMTYG